MAKQNKNFTKQSLTTESDIFNGDLSAKSGIFPELDDKGYPAKLIAELKQEQQKLDQEADDCPPAVARKARLRGFHKYRTAAYIHDQDGRGHYKTRPQYGEEVLKSAVAAGRIRQSTCDVLSDDTKWMNTISFPRPGSPGKYCKDSQRFLLQNINTHKDAATDPEKKDIFYLTGGWIPYRWTAHHLIPHELLTEKELGEVEYKLLQESGYDVNNGHNGIIAPSESWGTPMHCLLQHKGNHPAYTQFVLGQIEDVKASLKKLADQVRANKESPKDHKTVLADILKDLTTIENTLWKRILAISKKVVPPALQADQTDTPLVSFARGKSKFPFGVLS